MKLYYFNKNTDGKGNHEVHTSDCDRLPNLENSILIGYFYNCQDAITSAKNAYPYKSFDGCFYCCNSCHKN
ncbi:hypothetical protein IEQ_05036 [Bacillus cereus BAG6X1-2]|nr:hypothetical protein IEQ_05036 [Bacillus cereus BAG6X1-2]